MALLVKLTFAVVLVLVLFPQNATADIQCYGTVQSAVTDAAGNITVGIVPTPPSTQQPCPPPCNPDATTHWTYLSLASGSAGRDLVFSGALAGVISGKPVFIGATPPSGSSQNCQINVLQLKYQ